MIQNCIRDEGRITFHLDADSEAATDDDDDFLMTYVLPGAAGLVLIAVVAGIIYAVAIRGRDTPYSLASSAGAKSTASHRSQRSRGSRHSARGRASEYYYY